MPANAKNLTLKKKIQKSLRQKRGEGRVEVFFSTEHHWYLEEFHLGHRGNGSHVFFRRRCPTYVLPSRGSLNRMKKCHHMVVEQTFISLSLLHIHTHTRTHAHTRASSNFACHSVYSVSHRIKLRRLKVLVLALPCYSK